MGEQLKTIGLLEILCFTFVMVLLGIGIYFSAIVYAIINAGPYEHSVVLLYISIFAVISVMAFILAAVMFYLFYRRIKRKKP